MSDAPLMLSISGLRGLIGKTLTPPVVARYAAAFGEFLKRSRPQSNGVPRVVLGRDSRPSGEMLEQAAIAGLLSVGCRVTSLGIVTTPSVAIMAEHLHADGGMVITASHNPIIWNGVKALRHDGVAPPPEEANQIIARFKADDVTYAPVEQIQKLERDETTNRVHVDRVLKHIDVDLIRRRRPKVVLDSVHGAGGPAAAMLLRELGVELVHLYAEPTGRFPHTPEPTRENLVGLSDAVRQHKADIGFAQDPDADRLAIVDETGAYIGEEYTLALSTLHVLEREGPGSRAQGTAEKPPSTPASASPFALGPGPCVCANLSTSRMVDDIAAKVGGRVIRTPVGEANVAAAMRKHKAVIGGEGNGGVIWPKVIYVRDSIAGIALMLELLAARNQPLSRIAAEIPRYAIVKDKVEIKPGMTERIAPAIKSKWPSQPVDTQDGVRVDWPAPDNKWVHVRASNTEPILRLIAEARDEHAAKSAIAEVRGAMGL
jgi:phosphomannomutase